MNNNPKSTMRMPSTRVVTETHKDVFARAEILMRDERLYTAPTLTLGTMAAMLGVNRETLSHAVNLLTGNNFAYFVNRYRIEEAKRLLNENKYSEDRLNISVEAGFANHTSFYRSFKKIAGITPGEYLRKLKLITTDSNKQINSITQR